MIRKILKWTGISFLALIVLLVLLVSFRQNLTYDAPYPEIRSSADSAVIARGKEIVFGPAHCANCHHLGNSDSLFNLGQVPTLSGGFKFELPLGNFYVPNITPDSTTGIGRYTDGEIARVLRHGVRANGTAVLDFMPFHDMSEEDMTAVISFLRSQQPVQHKIPANTVTVMGRVVKAFLIKPVGPSKPVIKSIARDSSAEYGKYLAYSVANCNGCHTNRDMMTGQAIGEPFAGGLKFEEPGVPALVAPNITPHAESRIHGWSQADFIKRFRMGKLIPYTHMPWSSFKRMSDNDLKAIYNFLQTLQPAKTGAPLAKK
jgi:mono/diheme cytochrome c family protein